jgi:hypothetical protein
VLAEVQEYARNHSSEAIDGLPEIARNKKSPRLREPLPTTPFSIAHGADVTTNRKSMDQMSDAELLAIAAGADDEETSATAPSRVTDHWTVRMGIPYQCTTL